MICEYEGPCSCGSGNEVVWHACTSCITKAETPWKSYLALFAFFGFVIGNAIGHIPLLVDQPAPASWVAIPPGKPGQVLTSCPTCQGVGYLSNTVSYTLAPGIVRNFTVMWRCVDCGER